MNIKTSELIHQLEELMKEHGDLRVEFTFDGGYYAAFDGLDARMASGDPIYKDTHLVGYEKDELRLHVDLA